MDNQIQRAQQHNIQARLRIVNQALNQINMTINGMKNQRDLGGSGGVMGELEAQKEKLIAEKIELTGAIEISDAVAPVEDTAPTQTSAEENARAVEKQGTQAFQRPGKQWKEYKYEDLFQENIDGDLILTFPDEIFKETGWKEGDELDFEVVAGNLHIKKRVDVSKLK
jgi:hypothetical protein